MSDFMYPASPWMWDRKKLSSKRMHGLLGMRSDPYGATQSIRQDHPRPKLYPSSDAPRHDDQNEQVARIAWAEFQLQASTRYENDATEIGQSMEAGITDIPDEILLAICQASCLTEDDWYCLAYVRPFHHIATTMLYSEVNCHGDNMVMLLRTLIGQPKLAAMVKTLDIEYPDVEIRPNDEDSWVFLQFALSNGFRVESYYDWFTCMGSKEQRNSVLIALLTLATPKVHRLSIPDVGSGKSLPFLSTSWITAFPQKFAPESGLAFPHFHSLKKVHIEGGDIEISYLRPLFHIASLETLAIMGHYTPPDLVWDTGALGPERTSNITTIDLFGGDFYIHSLTAMINKCRQLRAFAFDACALLHSSEHGIQSDLTLLAEALEPHTDTLRFLSIDDTAITKGTSTWKPMGSLATFTALECVRVDVEVLWGPRSATWAPLSALLPDSVREVYLDQVHRGEKSLILQRLSAANGLLSDLAEDRTKLPNLEVLTMAEEDEDEDEDEDEEEEEEEREEKLDRGEFKRRGVLLATYVARRNEDNEDDEPFADYHNYMRFDHTG